LDITSAVSRKSRHRPVFAFARKSSINRTPILYPLHISFWRRSSNILSSCLFTSFASSVSLHSWATTEPYVRTNNSAFLHQNIEYKETVPLSRLCSSINPRLFSLLTFLSPFHADRTMIPANSKHNHQPGNPKPRLTIRKRELFITPLSATLSSSDSRK